jgi:hypothetical protein
VLVLSERHLRQVLAEYARHYNGTVRIRACSRNPTAPAHPTVDISAKIEHGQVLGGATSEYRRAA